ncbi:MAG: PQQ-binding-like beta-propeller repeat protein [Acidobacteriota bacterium]
MRRSIFVLGLVLVWSAVTAAGSQSPEERLWEAARTGDVATVRALLAKGVPVDAKTEFDCTALYFAANSNETEVMKVLLEAGASPDVRDNSYGFNAIGMAAWLGHAEATKVLLEAGVAPGDAIGALFAATGNGHTETVKTLLAKVEVPPAQLSALLGSAQGGGHADLVALLKAAGAKAPEGSPATETAESKAPDEEKKLRFDPTLDKKPPVVKPAPWPEFRGAERAGVADGQHPPLAFDVASGRNVRWRAPVEGLGLSSPVIWGDRIFVTTAVSAETEQTVDAGALGNIDAVDETARHDWQLHAYALGTGERLWERTVTAGAPKSQRHWKASQANPTCATDGEVVVAFFGSEGLFAYSVDGKKLWHKDLGILNSGWYLDSAFEWGFASSPILDDGRVIVQVDVHGESFVAAYELTTGKELWRTVRDELPSWGTPLVYRDGERAELVLSASKAVVGYDPATGRERWRILGNSPITVASPIAQDGLIFATGGYRTPKPVYAIKPGGRGDLTPEEGGSSSHVAWSSQTDGIYVPTPLLYRGILYMGKGNGVLTARDPATGEEIYKERLRGKYTASPVAADGRIYFTAEDGDVTVIQAGRTLKVLAESELGSASLATPAISNGTIVFRTVEGLVGVGFTG